MNPRPPPLEPVAGVDLAHEARFQLGSTEVRPATLELVRDGASATVERKVMQALVVLARRPGEVTSRDELVEHVWSGRFIGEDAIHRVIAKLRQAAEAHCGGDFTLDTIPRVGYRLVVGGVRDAAPAAADGATRWRPGRRTWIAAAAAALVLAVAGVAAVTWWPQPAPGPPVVRLVGLTALGPDVPAALPASLTDDVRSAFGTDSVVILRDRDPDFVLSGRIRRVDDKLRLTMRLDDARDGAMVWSSVRQWRAVERVSPRFNATNIAQVMRCGLLDGAHLATHALGLYLQYCDARWTLPQQHDRAAAIARRLLQEAPRFARGWSSLAWSADAIYSLDPKRADATVLRAEAKAAAAKALSLDPHDAQAYEVQAYLLPETAYAARHDLLRRASENRLTACGCQLVAYGGSLLVVGRLREAMVQYQRAYQREPLGDHAGILAFRYAALGDADRSDQAFAELSEVYADQPFFIASAMRRAAYAGRWSEAARLAVTGARPQSRDALIAAFKALADADPTRIAAARPGIEKAAAAAPDVSFYALVLAALDDRPAALDVIERTVNPDRAQLYHPTILAALRHEPRYLRVLEREGLIQYWRETRTRPDLCAAPDPPAFCKTLR